MKPEMMIEASGFSAINFVFFLLLSQLSFKMIFRNTLRPYMRPRMHSFTRAHFSTRIHSPSRSLGIQTTLYYAGSVIVVFIGATYLAVPLYQLLCTQTGLDGTPMTAPGHKFEPDSMIPMRQANEIKVSFNSSLSEKMKWKFVPEVPSVTVVPGETALTFFKVLFVRALIPT